MLSSDQFFQLLFVEVLYDFAYVLALIASCDEQGVLGFDDDEIIHSDKGNELFRMYEVAFGMEGEAIGRGNDVLSFSPVTAPMLVESSPRAEVVPPERRWDAENSRVALALARARLQHSVVDADVLAFRIELGES